MVGLLVELFCVLRQTPGFTGRRVREPRVEGHAVAAISYNKLTGKQNGIV